MKQFEFLEKKEKSSLAMKERESEAVLPSCGRLPYDSRSEERRLVRADGEGILQELKALKLKASYTSSSRPHTLVAQGLIHLTHSIEDR